MDSLYQIVNGLVGNVDWGESLTIVTYEFRGLNRMMDCKTMATPMASNLKLLNDVSSETVDAMLYRQMIGSLMYLTNMRPDICFDVNTLSQFLIDMRNVHLIAANHILRYLRGIIDYGLKYNVNQKINLKGYVDSDWAGSSIAGR